MPFNIGIVGAARRRQGTGPFVARELHAMGHQIVGVVGSTPTSATDATAMLKNQFGISTRGFESLAALFAAQHVDIVAICSPPETHLNYLQTALEHRAHVFCEKPLWWPASDRISFEQYQQQIRSTLNLARQHGCHIHINTQWPYTLREFYRLHPTALPRAGALKQFAMHLCPQSQGPQMLVDAASHGLSLLYQLTGAGELVDIVADHPIDPDYKEITIQFKYVHSHGTTEVTFGLSHTLESPKPARYQLNGHKVNRLVALPDYQIQLQSDQTTLNILDPLTVSIRDCIAHIEAETECDTVALELGATHLYTLIDACS